MTLLHTTLGPLERHQLGLILPHEHVFVDLRTPDQPGYAEADADDVIALMAPQIAAAKDRGVTAIVECTTGGVGRRADIDIAVSKATGMPIVVPTGNYREPWIPAWVAEASEDALERWMLKELTEGMDETGVRAAWIKISAGDDGITPMEEKILRAAVRAAIPTNAVIGSHTIKGRVVLDQLDIIAEEGGNAGRFISIHSQAEPDFGLNLAVAERGAWIEYDHIGRDPDDEVLALIMRALEAGLGKQMLLSHDLGWYDPAQKGGGVPRPYTHLMDWLLPALHDRGVGAEIVRQVTHDNPFDAFAR
ncbi:phosphotriesterase family protein [Devosia chinhatensis]|uniref:Esterase n=1 Tax=Devosia chinhatensis TaxID=429727 RepID=A0A0F5FNG1_9HYPH|nr:esterase [Devosia chinhatensis]KKB09727.1 esterase [Devosia chinhatensis]